MNRIFAFSHIPKTAGMTLNHLLCKHFGHRHLSVAYRGRDVLYRPEDLRKDLRIQPFARSITGHSLKAYLDFSGFPLVWYTFLRNPVDRFVSHYQHEVEKGGKTCSFSEWHHMYRRQNWQVRMIAGEEDLKAAMQILESKFAFIGIQENFNESLLIMRQRLQMNNFDIRYFRPVNTARHGTISNSIKSNLSRYRAEIEDNNELDIQLYDFALNRLWPRQKEAYGLDNLDRDYKETFEAAIRHTDGLRVRLRKSAYLINRNLIYKPYVLLDKALS